MQLQEPTLEGVTKEKKFYDIDTRIRKYRHETLMSKKVFSTLMVSQYHSKYWGRFCKKKLRWYIEVG
jgi:hypothetical protein